MKLFVVGLERTKYSSFLTLSQKSRSGHYTFSDARTTRHLTARHLTTRHFSTRYPDNSPPWQLVTLTTRHSDNSPLWQLATWQLATMTTRHPDNSPPLQLVTMAYMPGSVSLFWLFFISMFALYCSPDFSFNILQIFCSDQWDPTFITSF
jgi:hypothetical protein